jgi:glycosyltransferase involved in cell wall biosynthesis
MTKERKQSRMYLNSSVVHLIPYNGIGGVEAAVRSLTSGTYQGLRVQKCFLARRSDGYGPLLGDYIGPYFSENDPRNLIQVLLWLHQRRPQLLIASLWRSYLILILYKLLHPRCRMVCFLHCNRAVHPVDWLLAFGSIYMATEVWADSQATLRSRVPKVWLRKGRVISFVLRRVNPVTREQPSPRFLFWGRLVPQKGLDQALQIIASLKRTVPDVRFQVVGPDQGEQRRLEQLVNQLKLEMAVSFLGPKSPEEIETLAAQASFYLQTSTFEGMAVSVVEAMQYGLVPIVTPVGEIERYCHDHLNALFVDTDNSLATAQRIRQLLTDPTRYEQLRQQAIHTWINAPTYQDDVLRHCHNLLAA